MLFFIYFHLNVNSPEEHFDSKVSKFVTQQYYINFQHAGATLQFRRNTCIFVTSSSSASFIHCIQALFSTYNNLKSNELSHSLTPCLTQFNLIWCR